MLRVRVPYVASGSVHFSAIVPTSTYECGATPNYVNCYVNWWVKKIRLGPFADKQKPSFGMSFKLRDLFLA